jgi:hypothetical protein
MLRRISTVACLIVAIGAFCASASADSVGPITFESPAYTIGTINGQNGWSMTGPYDVAVAATSAFPDASVYGFGDQSLRLSDAVTSGSFGDQTFAPALSQPAGESTPQRFFEASFQIGATQSGVQPGLHMSVSPDNGQGARMSYLRFEDRSDGIHVFFVDVTDSGPVGTAATFNETDVATLSRATAHTIAFSIHFIPGPGNDVVAISIDGSTVRTGTTWEDYYRYDPEQAGSGNQVPTTSTMLFRESGGANTADQGYGFLVDHLAYASSAPTCTPTGFMRDGIDLTAAQIGGSVTGTLDATGCNIGAYNPTSVSGANIYGANYFGVVVNHASVNVTSSTIHDIGEVPFNGAQHGNAILYINGAAGIISRNMVSSYQKNGITISGNNGASSGPSPFTTSATVTNNVVVGQGPVSYIAQNGIQISFGAKGSVTRNTVTGNAYTGSGGVSSGGILVAGGPCFGPGFAYTTGSTITRNQLTGNDVGAFLFNANLSCDAPSLKTNNSVKLNTIFNGAVTNTTGEDGSCGYQAGVSDLGHRDAIVNNKISGAGYTRQSPDCSGTPPAFLRFIDSDSSARALPSNK